MLSKWRIFILAICAALTSSAQNPGNAKQASPPESSRNFFILQKNNLFGLGDSGKWFINTPTGDSIIHLGNSYFAVRNNNYYTICNESFQTLQQGIKKITEFGHYYFLQDSLGWKLFPTSDDLKNTYFDSIHVNDLYATLYKKNKQGLFHKNWNLEDIIQPLYDKAGPYYNGVLLIDGGKLGWKGHVNIPIEFDHIYKEQQDVMAAKNNSGTVYYSLPSSKKLLAEPKDSIVFYDNLYKRISGKRQSIFHLATNELFGEINGYEIHPYSFNRFHSTHNYCVVVKDSSCALFKNGKILTGFEYDNFLPESNIHPPFFKVIKNKNAGVINERGEFQLQSLYTDILDRRGNYYIVRKGNLLGICMKGDSVILPPKYNSINFSDAKYAYVSFDGKLFGIYDYVNGKSITACNYNAFGLDSIFILAKRGDLHDIYFKENLKFSDLYDAESNGTTVKGYKDGKIFMGYARNGLWEEYSYEIPSYKVVSDRFSDFSLRGSVLNDIEDLYDYSTGKWGVYSFNSQQWVNEPLAHSGDNADGVWILGFFKDTTTTWNGINFHSQKSISPIDIAWQKKSKYLWMDVRPHTYSSHEGHNNITNISPVCYTYPGKGQNFLNNKQNNINFVFGEERGRNILAENGKMEIAKQGDISLSDFITQLSTNGNIHPASTSDYEKIIDPAKFIKISGASEHVLQVTSARRYISFFTSFGWLHKRQFHPLIVRSNGKYGALSDSGDYVLRMEYENIEAVKTRAGMFLKVGVRGPAYKLYDPKTKTFSGPIAHLLDSKGELLLVQINDRAKAVLNSDLDTLAKSNYTIILIGEKDYCMDDSIQKTVYRVDKKLFAFSGNSVEKINDTHFLVKGGGENLIVNSLGETLFKSAKAIKYLSLGDHYLLEDGSDNTLFGINDKVIYKFEKQTYLANEKQDLLIKEESSVTIFEKNKTKKITLAGKLVKATKHFVVMNTGKFKTVCAYSGELILPKAKQVKEINDEYLTYSEGKNNFLLNTNTKEKKKIKSLNVNLTKEGIDYEDVSEAPQTLFFKESDSLVISEHNGKYGLSTGEKTVLSHKFFHIKKFTNKYLVQDQIVYKLYNSYTNKFVSDSTFENIQPYKGYLMVIKKGKIAYIDTEGKILE